MSTPSADRETTVVEAIRQTLDEELARDSSVVLLGEDLGVYGGAFGVTAGLLEKYGANRVRETPISEAGTLGLAIGAALVGFRPIVEFMFADFMTLAVDQLVNHAAKISFMYGGQTGVPLVVRAPFGAGRGYGASHSQSLEAWFVHTPGLKVVVPSNPSDARRLLKAAVRDDNPVLFLEPKLIYAMTGPLKSAEPVGRLDGESHVVREGTDLTMVGYGYQLHVLLKAAHDLETRGVRAEVVDVPVLKPLDLTTVHRSVAKTRHALVLEEAPELCSVGTEIAHQIYRQNFSDLQRPIVKLSGKDTPIPSALDLERRYLPQVEEVVDASLQMVESRVLARSVHGEL
jgi:pyruvate/2-oxoglutarate/acetoin dehydrogenase E1 component